MSQYLWGIALCCCLLAPQAQAISIQHMQQRLDRAENKPEKIVREYAEKLVCKQDKKPVCYASAVVFDGDRNFHFALVKISRPELHDGYLLLLQEGKDKWKAIHAGLMSQLSLAHWKAKKVHISDLIAARLIQKLSTAR